MTLVELVDQIDIIDLRSLMQVTVASVEIITDEEVEIEFDIFAFREKLTNLLTKELP